MVNHEDHPSSQYHSGARPNAEMDHPVPGAGRMTQDEEHQHDYHRFLCGGSLPGSTNPAAKRLTLLLIASTSERDGQTTDQTARHFSFYSSLL
ncbi:hypothetical protein HYQ46_004555 [Verticillium longisporum]|nr:hypothetical protein HYQ46_004555 [Verticillium longisporum]